MCCSRNTFAIIIASLNILADIVIAIASVVFLVRYNNIELKDVQRQREALAITRTICIVLLVVSIVMTVLSGLLLMGILKKRYKLMIPWMVISGIGFIYQCGNFLFQLIGILFSGGLFTTAGLTVLFTFFLAGLLGIGISGLILWVIFKVFKDIRKETTEMAGRTLSDVNVEYQTNYKT